MYIFNEKHINFLRKQNHSCRIVNPFSLIKFKPQFQLHDPLRIGVKVLKDKDDFISIGVLSECNALVQTGQNI